MLRRPPTAISLSNRDVLEHFDHVTQRQCHKAEYAIEQSINYSSGESSAGHIVVDERHSRQCQVLTKAFGNSEGSSVTSDSDDECFQPEVSSPHSLTLAGLEICQTGETGEIYSESATMHVSLPGEPPTLEFLKTHESSSPDGELNENDGEDQSYRASSPFPQDDFGYRHHTETHPEKNPPNSPENSSTPQANLSEIGRLRMKAPLPRSPLYRAHVACSSPEKLPTTSLSPRLASHGTPGLLLSRPARRPRSYKPRSISYSFEESERASAAYADYHNSDEDSNSSRTRPKASRNLRQELRNSSLRTSNNSSDVPSSSPETSGDLAVSSLSDNELSPRTSNELLSRIDNEALSQVLRNSCDSPTQLSLPPPFSTVSRRVFTVGSMPAGPSSRDLSSSPPKFSPARHSSHKTPTVSSQNCEERVGEPRPTSIETTFADMVTLPIRLLAAYRARSPIRNHSGATESPSAASNGRESRAQSRLVQGDERGTPRQRFVVYNDGVPASHQPQTPQHLPESRHQSHYHPSYTAPVGRRMNNPRIIPRSSRQRNTRSDSPAGLETPGFRGLYSGQENADEEVTFDRAARRLWALSASRTAQREGSATPEAERSFPDYR